MLKRWNVNVKNIYVIEADKLDFFFLACAITGVKRYALLKISYVSQTQTQMQTPCATLKLCELMHVRIFRFPQLTLNTQYFFSLKTAVRFGVAHWRWRLRWIPYEEHDMKHSQRHARIALKKPEAREQWVG